MRYQDENLTTVWSLVSLHRHASWLGPILVIRGNHFRFWQDKGNGTYTFYDDKNKAYIYV